MCVEFQLSSSSSFGDMRGPKFTQGGAKNSIPEKSTWPRLNVCKISTF